MSLQTPPARDALRALELFLHECCMDRPSGPQPLRELVVTSDVGEFHQGLEWLVRGLLLDYSLEQRSLAIKEELQRSLRRQCFH